MSALTGTRELAVGNALGSNIANIGLVLGVTLMIKPISVGRPTTLVDIPLLIIAVLVTAALLSDKNLSTSDSLILVLGMLLFFLRIARHNELKNSNNEKDETQNASLRWAIVSFLGGLILLLCSSRLLVWAASNLARAFGVSELIIGLTIVAIGTSLPELAASVMSAVKGHADMAIGAIIGSNMFNILLVLAIPGFWGDLPLSEEVLYRDLLMVFLTTTALALSALGGWNTSLNRSTLGKFSGMLFLFLYGAYYTWLFFVN